MKEAPEADKKSYSTPKLTTYGNLTELVKGNPVTGPQEGKGGTKATG